MVLHPHTEGKSKPDEPFWMTAKRDGHCAECEDDITQGDRMVYDPSHYKAYCSDCGEEIAGDDPKHK